jgi:hypothetical protein
MYACFIVCHGRVSNNYLHPYYFSLVYSRLTCEEAFDSVTAILLTVSICASVDYRTNRLCCVCIYVCISDRNFLVVLGTKCSRCNVHRNNLSNSAALF